MAPTFSERLAIALEALRYSRKSETLDFISMSEGEIRHIEESLRVKLPDVYKEFMLLCGNTTSHYHFLDINGVILYPEVIRYTSMLNQELEDDGEAYRFSEDSIMFQSHQDEMIWFFRCDEIDPYVYLWDWDIEPENTGYRLSDFLIHFFYDMRCVFERSMRFRCMDFLKDFVDGKENSLSELKAALRQIDIDFEFFYESNADGLIIRDLLACLCKLNTGDDAAKLVIHLLEQFDDKVNEIKILVSLDKCEVSELTLLYLNKFAENHEITKPKLKELLLKSRSKGN